MESRLARALVTTVVVLVALAPASLFLLAASPSSESSRVAARPAGPCGPVAELLALQSAPPGGFRGPSLLRWRDALRALDRGGDPVLHDRRRAAERVVDALVRHGAGDPEDVRYSGPLIAAFVRSTAVHPAAPVLPAPTGWGCRGVTALRVAPSLVGFDAAGWSLGTRLPGVGDATTARALHDIPLLGSSRRFTAFCSRWLDHGLGSPLGRGWGGSVRVDTRSSLSGTTYRCGYGDRRHRLTVAMTTDLRRTADLLAHHRRSPVSTRLGGAFRVERVRLPGGPTSTAYVFLDPSQRGGLLVTATSGLDEAVLGDVATALARTTYR